ncbi:MAG: cob(I)yrinic acid a,c-diamide adenosyltransferase [Lentisphaerae bacterium]|jgi:cob(I)alamin adenosyltransferase|nr:cob(I)yrinic acid a,c-diamide adenosyltransferase [Lentisphaerota bacterium]MBT5611950.1 cob(I)yrinic acid a,c-diamide adenosyltransferase [Lentisphaerota bacterium]MBT7062181.1 cob(I)yrinic acid a,c-diamide adenosyltransferase [Lentisphaerota bacterium]MBT7843717.1 cob(I)yrinic acid a,c-diamide adenosyltransferase [Lentisphaerota bacterium]
MPDAGHCDWDTGYVQVYTGDGKGKTTAAFGLAVRAVGAGLKVFIGQFVKGMHYSELDAMGRFSGAVELRQYGRDCFIRRDATPEDKAVARAGLEDARQALVSGDYDLVILDEANIATHFSLFSVDDLLGVIDAKPNQVELVITGRRADPRIMERADLVTEMREIKHYYADGVPARHGIEN